MPGMANSFGTCITLPRLRTAKAAYFSFAEPSLNPSLTSGMLSTRYTATFCSVLSGKFCQPTTLSSGRPIGITQSFSSVSTPWRPQGACNRAILWGPFYFAS
ncbi:hypothetical protein RvY_03436-2 [Ramazzottius varieornatus]|uniref:Uncharacterized protein n=1 Tax=Ramazzottius varieornatus TaxID=947166 RepID=A0A1D1UN14_RAMVA|nr:hypothetical protein RvY_03436-2 [Ramazzottius varieornatus]